MIESGRRDAAPLDADRQGSLRANTKFEEKS